MTKVAGFALHRRAGHVLVQGSIVRAAIALGESDDENLLRNWARALGVDAKLGSFNGTEEALASEYEENRYGTDGWNRRV